MMRTLEGKTALVTGAAKVDGIGFAACIRLIEAGASVMVTDLGENDDAVKALHDRVSELTAMGGNASCHALDVSSKESVEAAISKTINKFGGLDILFNNAGYAGGAGEFMRISDDAWRLSWDVNLMGIVNTVRAVLPIMKDSGGGSIINNASLAGLGCVAGMSAYSASKFAAVGLTKSLAVELGEHNIRVNAICPGMVMTGMGKTEIQHYMQTEETLDDAATRLAEGVALGGRWADPLEIGDAVVFLAGPGAAYMTGVALPVAGGLAPGL